MAFKIIASTVNLKGTNIWDAFGVCQRCDRGALFVLEPNSGQNIKRGIPKPEDIAGDVADVFVALTKYPDAGTDKAPEHTPEAVGAAFVDALKALNSSLWTPAGVMARKTVDLATKRLDPNTKKGSKLEKRIDALRAKGLITDALQLMAHVVRLDGNEAAHEEEPFTEDEAKEICEFARLFLTLTFTVNGDAETAAAKYPDLVEKFRKEADQSEPPSADSAA